MLKEETLEETGRREYEEPEGEFLEIISQNSNTISVLTRVKNDGDDSDKGETVPTEDLPDPANYSVADLEAELEEKVRTEGLTEAQRAHLIEEEQSGKDRTTAITAIKEA